ncbi:MAG TPA: PilZ domain-containing protein [Longimicrobiaceae bacterium]|nr:PilZ domain-containing protein [Longimicrobiaceae bacterium]
MSQLNRREFQRIDYPDALRPRLWSSYGCLEVLDCSERGLRCRLAGQDVPGPDTEVEGRLRFAGGRDVHVAGRVVRVREDAVALDLAAPGIPFQVILQEQLQLRRSALPPEEIPRLPWRPPD